MKYSRSTCAGRPSHQPRTDVAIVSIRQARGESLSPHRVHIVDSDEAQGSAPESNALGSRGDVVRDGRGRDDVVTEGGEAYNCGPSVFAEPAVHPSGSVARSVVYEENRMFNWDGRRGERETRGDLLPLGAPSSYPLHV